MSKKKAVQTELKNILSSKIENTNDKIIQSCLIESLKRLSKELLIVSDYEEVFGEVLVNL